MRTVVFSVALLGMAMIAGAQTTQAPATTWTLVTNSATNGADGLLRHATNVVIQIGTIRLTADEIDLDPATGRMDLRGNVQMLTPPR